MNKDGIMQFGDDLDRLVERARMEYDLSYAEVVGTLHMKAFLICHEASEEEET